MKHVFYKTIEKLKHTLIGVIGLCNYINIFSGDKYKVNNLFFIFEVQYMQLKPKYFSRLLNFVIAKNI